VLVIFESDNILRKAVHVHINTDLKWFGAILNSTYHHVIVIITLVDGLVGYLNLSKGHKVHLTVNGGWLEVHHVVLREHITSTTLQNIYKDQILVYVERINQLDRVMSI
jgi:hypothetical protein